MISNTRPSHVRLSETNFDLFQFKQWRNYWTAVAPSWSRKAQAAIFVQVSDYFISVDIILMHDNVDHLLNGLDVETGSQKNLKNPK